MGRMLRPSASERFEVTKNCSVMSMSLLIPNLIHELAVPIPRICNSYELAISTRFEEVADSSPSFDLMSGIPRNAAGMGGISFWFA